MCEHSSFVSSDSYHVRNYEFTYETPQIADRYDDGQSPRKQVSKIQKLAFRCFLLTSAKAKKFQGGNQSTRLYTAISLHLRHFSKIATIFILEGHRFFPAMGSMRSETKHKFSKITKEQTHTTHGQMAITLHLCSG